MPPKSKQNETPSKKSIFVVPSRVITQPVDIEGGEETEIAAQITVPHEGKWGWVVVFCTFWSIFILDGVVFTFGSIFADITLDFGAAESLVSLINSTAMALYFVGAPFASAYLNRFGFRACIMTGSVISSFSLLISYFTTTFGALFMFYGFFAGVGYCMINMATGLVVGFYFEKLRALALALATSGSSIGIMVMFPINTAIVKIAGWRVLTLLHSGLFGMIFFLGMSYRPLLSLTIMNTSKDDPTKTVTYLPSLAAVKTTPSRTKTEGLTPTATEKLFSAVSNANFPTAAAVVDEVGAANQPGTSAAGVSKLTITAQTPEGGLSHRQIKQVQSIMSKASMPEKSKLNIEMKNVEPPKKRSRWGRIFHWERHVPQARPMYRDDAFYGGQLKNLPAYQKSMMDTGEAKTGLEYQLAVSRAVTTADLQERRGVFTTAARRILATMMDPNLLRRCSFMFLCSSAFVAFLGFLVPYVFIQDRNLSVGIDPKHCNYYVSAIGFSNAFGRIILGSLACKIDPVKLFICSCITAGLSTILSNLSFNLYYQYVYCTLFGFFISSVTSLRCLVLVQLYGLEKLTNATGIMLVFQGMASMISTPVASILKMHFGYSLTFYAAGFCITLSGLLLIPMRIVFAKEKVP